MITCRIFRTRSFGYFNRSGWGAKINLMTMHAAKGLEFDVVFLQGGRKPFPHQKSLEEKGDFALRKRRLAYVGITRAKRLFIFCNEKSLSR